MRKLFYYPKTIVVASSFFLILLACNSAKEEAPSNEKEETAKTNEDPVKRGHYLVTIGGCNDCHSPKVMTPQGPMPDTTKLLSGHPAGSQLPPIENKNTQWVLMAPDVTAFVGPWGISYAANLSSDSATGIGAWTEDNFVQALRTGKHLGNPNGRSILPPMPWYDVAKMTDEDIKAVYAYLQSLPPISNKVPQPVAPPDVQKMIK